MQLEVSQIRPLTQWEDGTIRITGTRVTLDVIIHQFKLGATVEQMHDSFPAASLQDIYGAIYYYLAHTIVRLLKLHCMHGLKNMA
jgi:uncharacterized protein (DUF433 family)